MSRNATGPGAASCKGGFRDCCGVTTDPRRLPPRMLVARTPRRNGVWAGAEIERQPAAFGQCVAIDRQPATDAFARYPALADDDIGGGAHPVPARALDQIGRASWRERLVHYV